MHIVFRNHNYYLKNHLETVVVNKIIELDSNGRLDCCTCKRCMSDLVAYTLNRLPPKYAYIEPGQEYARLEELSNKYGDDIETAINLGSKLVKAYPRHDDTHEKLCNDTDDGVEVFMENYVELLVVERLSDVVEKIDCCKCDHCLSDVAIYTLNRIQPRYVASIKGEAYGKIDTLHLQYETDVLRNLLEGAELVKANPMHTKEDLDKFNGNLSMRFI
ncbi:MAG: late competence development ComFB family protein [Clostridiales bacterium]|nr:late competence development ComFB family protein [Clostridiales bacterium]